jgi:hypothetical protein
MNDTVFGDFLTAALNFTVKEIRVFEIPDETTLPVNVETLANENLSQETEFGCFHVFR